MEISLIDKEDVIIHRGKEKKSEKDKIDKDKVEKENTGKTVIKKKSEKPIRILRIRYYEKISLSFMQEGSLGYKDAFKVDRSLEDLLKALGFNTKIQGTITSHDCIIVEKSDKTGVGNKFLFVDIGTNDFYILKKQMENYTTICAYNQGEFMILDGKRSSLTETFDIPKTLKEEPKEISHISDTNKIVLREKLRNDLKEKYKRYHLHDDEYIDKMSEQELVELKRLIKRKIEIEDNNRKFYDDFLK